MNDAPCVGRWELFSDDDDGTELEYTKQHFPYEAEAKALCADCPFLTRCLVEQKDSDMIVGGTTPAERSKVLRSRGIPRK